MNLDADIALAHRLADPAGAVIRPHFRSGLDTQRKGDASPVTEADRGAEEAMRRLLKAEAARDGVIGDGADIGARCELLRGARVWPGVVIPDCGIRYSSDI